MSEWKFLTLKEAELEFIDGDRGINYPKKSELLLEGDCVFLNTGNVRQNSFDFSNLDFITKEKDNLLRNGKLQRDDIVLTTRGTVGNVALYSQEVPFSNIRINSGMVIIRVNKNFWHPYFVYLFFQSHLFKKQISRLISGSAQPQLPISILETVSIPQLTLDEQKEIIFNIKSIDQKIQINNQINQELETMAKTLYDYWFVQFDFPDQNGKPYKSSGGKMVYNPELKRQIPEGWGVSKVGELQIATGKRDANFGTENGNYDFWTTANSPIKADEFSFEGKAILIAGNGNFYVNFTEGKFEAYQRTYVIQSEDENMLIFMYMACLQSVEKLRKGSNGSIIKYITIGDVNNIASPYNKKVVDDFVKIYSPLINLISKNKRQNQELTQLRDWLLPMLMNGQVKVK